MHEEERQQPNEDNLAEAGQPEAQGKAVVVITKEVEVSLDADAVRRQRQRYILIGGATILLLLLLAVWLLWRAKAGPVSATEEANVVVSVRVAHAERSTIAADVSSLGTIFPREQATVSPKINAQIKQMQLLKNSIVRAGQVIAVLESRDIQAQRAEALAAVREAQLNVRSVSGGVNPQATAQADKDLRDARANLDNARALYERRLTLYKLGGIALKDVEAAKLALAQAENSLRLAERTVQLRTNNINPTDRALAESRAVQAQDRLANLDAQLSYATIRAPITGVVTDQFQFEGEFAASGAKLMTISDISEVIVKAQFADTVVAKLKVGDPVTVVPTDLTSEEMKGQVSLVSRSSDPLNRTVEVWVKLGNGAGHLRAGGAAKVVVATNRTSDAIVVPATAVTLEASNAEGGTVMVVDAGGVAHERKVTVGIRTGDLIQITSGLAEGETVVIEGNYALPDGTRVEVTEEKPAGTDAGQADAPAAGEKP
jgi:multidrug efflux pump subunit AcrA (membrane-fusion protein)